MYAHFIDTSVLLNILLILPFAAIIETGNHIAHCGDGKEICKEFPNSAMRGEGFGDLSIIRAYQRYKEETPAVHKIRIWSVDEHLRGIYEEDMEYIRLRNAF